MRSGLVLRRLVPPRTILLPCLVPAALIPAAMSFTHYSRAAALAMWFPPTLCRCLAALFKTRIRLVSWLLDHTLSRPPIVVIPTIMALRVRVSLSVLAWLALGLRRLWFAMITVVLSHHLVPFL